MDVNSKEADEAVRAICAEAERRVEAAMEDMKTEIKRVLGDAYSAGFEFNICVGPAILLETLGKTERTEERRSVPKNDLANALARMGPHGKREIVA